MRTLKGRVKMSEQWYQIRIVIEGAKTPCGDIANFLTLVLHRKGVEFD